MHIPFLAHVTIVLVFLHVLAVAIGLGAALIADWIVLTKIALALAIESVDAITKLSKAISVGLVALWVTGLGLVAYHWQLHPASLLANETLWAKIAIVGVLTTNAGALHWLVLPALARRQGRPFFASRWSEPLFPTLCGAVSMCSWLSAAYLGAGREPDGVVTFQTVLGAYGVCLADVWGSVYELAAGATASQFGPRLRTPTLLVRKAARFSMTRAICSAPSRV